MKGRTGVHCNPLRLCDGERAGLLPGLAVKPTPRTKFEIPPLRTFTPFLATLLPHTPRAVRDLF